MTCRRPSSVRIRHIWQVRRGLSELAQLDDHELGDLGYPTTAAVKGLKKANEYRGGDYIPPFSDRINCPAATSDPERTMHSGSAWPTVLMGLASSFTLADLFAPQAITPAIGASFHQTPQATGVAVNAAVLGMAASGLLSSLFADRLNRKAVIVGSLLALCLPTVFIGYASGLLSFAGWRAVQGCLMAASFAASIAYIAEQWDNSGQAPTVMAGYVTGNIAGQIVGRILMGVLAEYVDWQRAFLVLGGINLLGGLLLLALLPPARQKPEPPVGPLLLPIGIHLRDARLRGCFCVGFLILVCFIGTFTYIGYDLTARFGLSPSMLGTAYGVFIVALLSTPTAGLAVRHLSHRSALAIGATVAAAGILLTLASSLMLVLAGLALAACGLFFCQAVATAFTGHSAVRFKAAAGGLYLASYYTGGLVGAAFIGVVYTNWGWAGSVWVMVAFSLVMSVVAIRTWGPSTAGYIPIAVEAC